MGIVRLLTAVRRMKQATTYQLRASVTSVPCSAAGVPRISSVYVSLYKTVGSNAPTISAATLRYRRCSGATCTSWVSSTDVSAINVPTSASYDNYMVQAVIGGSVVAELPLYNALDGGMGSKGARQRVRDWETNTRYLQGAGTEEWYDIAVCNDKRYLCLITHTSSTRNPQESVAQSDGYWALETTFVYLATRLMLAERITADQIDATDLVVKNGSIEDSTLERVKVTGSIATQHEVMPMVDGDGNAKVLHRMDISNCYSLSVQYVQEVSTGNYFNSLFRRILCLPQAQGGNWRINNQFIYNSGIEGDGHNISIVAQMAQFENMPQSYSDHILVLSDPRLLADATGSGGGLWFGYAMNAATIETERVGREMSMFIWRGFYVPFIVIRAGQSIEAKSVKTLTLCGDGTYREITHWQIRNSGEFEDLAGYVNNESGCAAYNPILSCRKHGGADGNENVEIVRGASHNRLLPVIYGAQCNMNVRIEVEDATTASAWNVQFTN